MGSGFSWRPAGHPQRPGEDNTSLRVFFSCFLRRSRAGHDRDAEPGFVRAARHSGHAQRIFQNRRVGGSKNTDSAGDRREGDPRWRGGLHFGLGRDRASGNDWSSNQSCSRDGLQTLARPHLTTRDPHRQRSQGKNPGCRLRRQQDRLSVPLGREVSGARSGQGCQNHRHGESFLRVAVLKDGSIDATAVDVALAVKAEEEGMTRLLHLGDIIDLPISGIAVASARLATHREQIKKVIQATFRGARFIKQKKPETVRIIQNQLRVTSSQAIKTYDSAIRSFTDDGFVSQRAVSLDLRRAKEEIQLATDPALSQVADWSVLREIKLERSKIPYWLKSYEP